MLSRICPRPVRWGINFSAAVIFQVLEPRRLSPAAIAMIAIFDVLICLLYVTGDENVTVKSAVNKSRT
jgi:hypothetical protein